MMLSFTFSLRIAVTISSALLGVAGLSAQGFGPGMGGMLGKKGETMALVRKLPPVVDLAGASVHVVTSSTGSVPKEVVEIMQTKLRAELLKDRARGIRLDDPHPQTELRCKVTSFELTEQQQNRDDGSVTGTYKVIIGNMEASVEIYDVKTGQAMDSENLKNKYEKWFKVGEVPNNNNKNPLGALGGIGRKKPKVADDMRLPTMSERYQAVVEGISQQVAQRLVPVDERLDVPLPGGKLKDLSALAQRSQWGRLLEEGEKMEPLAKAQEDSYRLYLLALASEAMGYASKSESEAQDYLLKSATWYEKARSSKKDEEKYREPDIRIRESVERYERIKVIRDKAQTAKSRPPTPPEIESPKATEYDNNFVLELHKASMPADFIIGEIKNAPNPKFDVSPQGVLFLAKQKVPAAVITAMREKMRSTTPATPAKPVALGR
jgi:hypothetical protein